jgi:ubiquinone/menaquinone biosynthesis C-methylase UbiE
MEKLKVRTDYDRSAFCYDKRYRSIQWEKYKTMITGPIHGKILDLGCGTGLLAEFLQKDVIGIDISLNMLKEAETRESVLQADMDFLPFQNAVFDAVVSFTCLQNLPSPDFVFKEVRRVLKKGCPFIFTMLQKKFSPYITQEVTHSFTITEQKVCGEDIGFICL